MALSCDPNSLQALAKCFHCLSPGTLLEVQTYLLCQIASNPSGGGSGTVTSFSAGNFSPLFNTSVATATTTPALSFTAINQAANLVYAGPAAGGAVAPTFRALVTADLGTTMTPQFARVGIGVAAAAVTPLSVLRNNVGNTEIGSFDDTTGNPFITVGTTNADQGSFWLYDRGANKFSFSIHGHSPAFIGDSSGNLEVTNNINCAGYQTNANPGLSQTFDTGIGNTQIQFLGGIAILIA